MFTLLLCLVIFVSRHSPAEDKTIKLYPGAAHQVPTKRRTIQKDKNQTHKTESQLAFSHHYIRMEGRFDYGFIIPLIVFFSAFPRVPSCAQRSPGGHQLLVESQNYGALKKGNKNNNEKNDSSDKSKSR